ncbi:hypothetical protein OIO90_005190 [Microbotryomycetes sp. JL221]|nr:hypothetical protein OIO90_005190 [Microbotryomycetes sp. JL221]
MWSQQLRDDANTFDDSFDDSRVAPAPAAAFGISTAYSCPELSSAWTGESLTYEQAIAEALQLSEQALQRAQAEVSLSPHVGAIESFPASPNIGHPGPEWATSNLYTTNIDDQACEYLAQPVEMVHEPLQYEQPAAQQLSPMVTTPQPRASSHDPWLQPAVASMSPRSTPASEAFYPSPPATNVNASPLLNSSSGFSPNPNRISSLPLPLQKPTPDAVAQYANSDLIGLGFSSRPPTSSSRSSPRAQSTKSRNNKTSTHILPNQSSSSSSSSGSRLTSHQPRRTQSSEGLTWTGRSNWSSSTPRQYTHHHHQDHARQYLHSNPSSAHHSPLAHQSPTSAPYRHDNLATTSTPQSNSQHDNYPRSQAAKSKSSIKFVNISASTEQDREALCGGYEAFRKHF